jgi:hypothetical protein
MRKYSAEDGMLDALLAHFGFLVKDGETPSNLNHRRWDVSGRPAKVAAVQAQTCSPHSTM